METARHLERARRLPGATDRRRPRPRRERGRGLGCQLVLRAAPKLAPIRRRRLAPLCDARARAGRRSGGALTDEDAAKVRSVAPKGVRIIVIPRSVEVPEHPLDPSGDGSSKVLFFGGYERPPRISTPPCGWSVDLPRGPQATSGRNAPARRQRPARGDVRGGGRRRGRRRARRVADAVPRPRGRRRRAAEARRRDASQGARDAGGGEGPSPRRARSLG